MDYVQWDLIMCSKQGRHSKFNTLAIIGRAYVIACKERWIFALISYNFCISYSNFDAWNNNLHDLHLLAILDNLQSRPIAKSVYEVESGHYRLPYLMCTHRPPCPCGDSNLSRTMVCQLYSLIHFVKDIISMCFMSLRVPHSHIFYIIMVPSITTMRLIKWDHNGLLKNHLIPCKRWGMTSMDNIKRWCYMTIMGSRESCNP